MWTGRGLRSQRFGYLIFSEYRSALVNEDPEEALEKLRSGAVAAVALVAGKPAPLFCDLIGENGLHFRPTQW